MKIRTLEKELLVPAGLDRVFAFFGDAGNLQRITPEFLQFEILTPLPIEMKPGAIIEYRLKLLGVPFRWRTEITVWEPGRQFVDVQRKGPYLLWEHEHVFSAEGNSTLMIDRLQYAVPGGILEPLIWRLFVKSRVESIFAYRNQAIGDLFPASDN